MWISIKDLKRQDKGIIFQKNKEIKGDNRIITKGNFWRGGKILTRFGPGLLTIKNNPCKGSDSYYILRD